MDFRDILKEEHRKRASKNPSYSLRAFARDLDMFPTRLIAVIKGRYGLSPDAALKIADRLSFNVEQKNEFYNLVKLNHGRSKKQREEAVHSILGKREGLPTPSEFKQIKRLLITCIEKIKKDSKDSKTDEITRLLAAQDLDPEQIDRLRDKFGLF